ncbi:hypothetical protein PBI_SCTP2_213 [Salicola phage SCTP-2]|nr:hypothetical protein PBI_SCTP2_213 [Salicola phage SCTP-2]
MKVNDILKEDNLKEKYEFIFNTQFFQQNYKPLIEKYLKGLSTTDTSSKEYDNKLGKLLDELNQNNLFHGREKVYNNPVINEFKYRRSPKDTQPFIHNYVNSIAKDEIGEPVRSLLFSYKNKHRVLEYGEPYYIIPVGNTTYYYNPYIRDFAAQYSISDVIDVEHIINEIRQTMLKSNKNINSDFFKNEFLLTLRGDIYKLIDYINRYSLEEKKIKTVIKKHITNDEDIIDIIYSSFMFVINDYLKMFNEYIENIEITDDISNIPRDKEIMIKTEQFVLIPQFRIDKIINYYWKVYILNE